MLTQISAKLTALTITVLLLFSLTSQANDGKNAPPAEVYSVAQVSTAEDCCEVMGDVNHDGELNPMDAVYFMWWFWHWGPQPVCMEEADVNCTGTYDPMDAVYLVAYLWGGGPEPCRCDEHPG